MARSACILLVDDEPAIVRSLGHLLAARGFQTECAASGAAALASIEQHPPDLVVLDLGLPDMDGRAVCRAIRGRSQVPIIILSARTGDTDKIEALDAGADDYVTKPFSPEELLARIRVALRRAQADGTGASGGRLACGELSIDFGRRRVHRGSTEVRLTPKEFELLTYLAEHPNRVLTHRTILTAIWGADSADHPEHLWVLVGQLRKKLEADPSRPHYLLSEPWVGYRFVTDGEVPRAGG